MYTLSSKFTREQISISFRHLFKMTYTVTINTHEVKISFRRLYSILGWLYSYHDAISYAHSFKEVIVNNYIIQNRKYEGNRPSRTYKACCRGIIVVYAYSSH